MYAKRIQIVNYGPVDQLDITFPFEGDAPKPVVLVGENGSGKSILLSHIVNGLISAQGIAYPETPEVEIGKVYKIRDSSYIKSGSEFYFARVDFEGELFIEEMRLARLKQEYPGAPAGLSGTDAQKAWEGDESRTKRLFQLRIPSPKQRENRGHLFPELRSLLSHQTALKIQQWLNEENLKAKAQYMDIKRFKGYTSRKKLF